MEDKKTCHECWQYHDYCKECDRGGCYWFFNHPSPALAESCEAFNNRYRENRKDRDEHAELMPKLEVFFEFLMGEGVPDGFSLKHKPKLTARKAFTVIYVLQEYLHILPDSFEQCSECLSLYDSEREGYYLDDQYDTEDGKTLPKKYWGHYCSDSCRPDIKCNLA